MANCHNFLGVGGFVFVGRLGIWHAYLFGLGLVGWLGVGGMGSRAPKNRLIWNLQQESKGLLNMCYLFYT